MHDASSVRLLFKLILILDDRNLNLSDRGEIYSAAVGISSFSRIGENLPSNRSDVARRVTQQLGDDTFLGMIDAALTREAGTIEKQRQTTRRQVGPDRQ
jgi:hypothetical protein